MVISGMNLMCMLVLALVLAPSQSADERGELIFQDDFDRVESQEQKDEPGNGWGSNSAKRAQGDKQVDLKDGAMRIFISPRADHAVSVTRPLSFTDGSVAVRFLLEDEKDSLGLNFADLQCKEVHAGHLFMTRIHAERVELTDLKTGNMRLDIRESRQAKKPLTDEQKKALKGKTKRVDHAVAVGKWHEVVVTVEGERISVALDGKPVGELTSPGIGHPTKRLLRLSVPRNVVVDDVRIWRKK